MSRILLLACPAFLLFGCPGDPVEPTLSSIQTNIFGSSCALSSCHDSGAEGNLDLSDAATSYAQMINVAPDEAQAQTDGFLRVDPGNPDNSYLYILLDETLVPEYANLMPKTPPIPIDADELEAVRQWIVDGAQDN